jgi:hypothetical protein
VEKEWLAEGILKREYNLRIAREIATWYKQIRKRDVSQYKVGMFSPSITARIQKHFHPKREREYAFTVSLKCHNW